MDVKQKLVDLIQNAVGGCARNWAELIADHLIANGVTVQDGRDNDVPTKWIPVTERLPEEECRCLVLDAAGDIEMDCYDGKGRFVLDRSGAVQHPSHWMPLPEPPKGE